MTIFQSRAYDLKELINQLTQNILEKFNKNERNDISILLAKRFELISELLALPVDNHEKQELLGLLIQLKERDQFLIQTIGAEHSRIRNTLANLANVQKYIS